MKQFNTKHFLVVVILYCLLLLPPAYSQNVGISASGIVPDNSAMLDVVSTTRGLLIPRLTQAERALISLPATSLLIYQTDATPGYYYNSGTPAAPVWERVGTATTGGGWTDDGTVVRLTTSTDNVGIGTTSPNDKLDVAGDARVASRFHFTTANADGGSFFLLGNLSGATKDFEIYDYFNGRPMIRVMGASRDVYMYGNVGIGTVSPGYKLDVQGGSTNVGALYGTYVMYGTLGSFDTRATNPNPETYNMGVTSEFKANASNGLSDGGTYNSVLSVRQWSSGLDWSGGGVHQLGFTQNGNLWQRYSQTTGVWGAWNKILTSGNISSNINGTTNYVAKFTSANVVGNSQIFDNGTNVGIGTTTPTNKLEVVGNALIQNVSISSSLIYVPNAGLQLIGGGPQTTRGYIDLPNGQGINIYGPTALGAQNIVLDNRNNGGYILLNGGNVGIGTTTPGAKLDVTYTGDVPFLLLNTTAAPNKRTRINFAQSGTVGMEIGTDYSMNNTNDFYFYNRATGATAGYMNPGSNVWFSGRSVSSDLYLNSAGNVGIGTTTPGFKLHVPSGYIGTDYINTTDNSVASGVTGVMVKQGDNYLRTGTAAAITTFLNTSGGWIQNQYAGAQSASSWISGETRTGGWFRNSASGTGLYNETNATGIYSPGAGIMAIYNNGSLGIGTTGPSHKLHVVGSAWNNIARIESTGGSSGIELYDSGLRRGVVYSSATGFGLLDSPTNWAVRITYGTNNVILSEAGGSVGIGTTGPNQKLEVSGNIRLTSMDNKLEIGGANHVASYGWSSYSGVSYPVTQLGDVSNRIFIGVDRYNGNVSGAFNGNEIISRGRVPWMVPNAANTSYVGIWGAGASDQIFIGNWSTPYEVENGGAVTILSSGNVGIGTTTPGFKLHVPSGYIGTDYINTTDNSVGSGVTGVMVKQGDNYFRTGTAAAVASFLGTSLAGNYIQNQYAGAQTANSWISGETRTGSWFRNSASGTGLYNETNGRHFYSDGASYWSLTTGNGLIFRDAYASTIQGYIYNDGTNFGILHRGGGWGIGTSTTRAFVNQSLMVNGTGTPSYALHVLGDVYANGGWFRVSGNQGLYWESWGPGWYVSDGTWLRTYNNASIWANTGQIGTNGSFTAGYGGTAGPAGGAIFSGNVGIGTTAPGAKLEVAAGGATYGVYSSGSGNTGVYGYGPFYGVYGSCGSGGYAGVYGTISSASYPGVYGYNSGGIGVYGYGASTNNGVQAYSAGGNAVGGYVNASGGYGAFYGYDSWQGDNVWVNLTNGWKIYGAGSVSQVIPTKDYGARVFFAPEYTEEWIGDNGSGQLVNGHARIEMDPIYIQSTTIDQNHPYRVQVTLTGPCNGIYVSKDNTGFDVYETGGGKSNASFDWDIKAKSAAIVNAERRLTQDYMHTETSRAHGGLGKWLKLFRTTQNVNPDDFKSAPIPEGYKIEVLKEVTKTGGR